MGAADIKDTLVKKKKKEKKKTFNVTNDRKPHNICFKLGEHPNRRNRLPPTGYCPRLHTDKRDAGAEVQATPS